MSDSTVTVIGATGRTGRQLVRALGRRGIHVRAVTRHPDRPGIFSGEVETRFGDLQDAASLVGALQGATSVHYIPPSLDACDPDYLSNILAAAASAGVSRIVYHSVLHSNTPEMPHHARKAGCERLLRHAHVAWTVIQPAMYVQTALSYLDIEAGRLSPPYDTTRPFNLIDVEDLAEAAAVIHASEGHVYATYELAGTERLDFVAMAAQLSELCERIVVASKVDANDYVARFAATRGLTAEQARERQLMFDYYDHHGLVGNGNVLRMLLGREPMSFTQAGRISLAQASEREAKARRVN